MFSTGQIIFALLFFLAFVWVIILMYRKDRHWQKKQYKGVTWVLIAFVSFIIILLLLKYSLKN
jgi:uncharacterized membrane protein